MHERTIVAFMARALLVPIAIGLRPRFVATSSVLGRFRLRRQQSLDSRRAFHLAFLVDVRLCGVHTSAVLAEVETLVSAQFTPLVLDLSVLVFVLDRDGDVH